MKKTKKILIEATFELLYKKGYCATGLADILNVVDMTKGAMYYHFTSKQELVLATMEYYLETILNDYWIKPFESTEKPLEILTKQINAYKDMFFNKKDILNIQDGCPLSNFILDMSNKDDVFFKYLSSVHSRWHESIKKVLLEAQNLKQTKTSFDSNKQALFIISSIKGSIASSKTYNDKNILRDNFDVLNEYINSL